MKRKFPFIGCYLLAFLLACVGMTFTCSCDRLGGVSPDERYDAYDSTLVAKCVYDYFNPTFNSIDNVVEYQAGIIEDEKADSFFASTDVDKLKTVAGVLFKRGEVVTIRKLYNEYSSNKAVYDNLPTTDVKYEDVVPDKATPPATEEQPTGVDNKSSMKQKSITYKDTTIDGKKYQIETKLSAYEQGCCIRIPVIAACISQGYCYLCKSNSRRPWHRYQVYGGKAVG